MDALAGMQQAPSGPGAAQPSPVPVLTPDQFFDLCRGPPLQGSSLRRRVPTFEPLGPDEAPHAGMLLGIDAEFVALSHPQKVLRE